MVYTLIRAIKIKRQLTSSPFPLHLSTSGSVEVEAQALPRWKVQRSCFNTEDGFLWSVSSRGVSLTLDSPREIFSGLGYGQEDCVFMTGEGPDSISQNISHSAQTWLAQAPNCYSVSERSLKYL